MFSPHADASLFRWDRGVAPFVKIGSSVIFDIECPPFDPDCDPFTHPNYEDLESMAYNGSARISSNSWGADVSGAYDMEAQRYDALVRDAQNGTSGNQEYTIVFAAGNSGDFGAGTIGSPGTAKNVITVGAAENVNPFGGADRSGIDDSGANNANDIIGFSSRGPCADERKKPEIVAPGTHVSGWVFQASIIGPPGSGNGQHDTCFDGSSVSGGPVPSIYWPLRQEWYTPHPAQAIRVLGWQV